MPKKEITFSAGDVLFKQGDPCASVYTIVSGKAELFYEINGKTRVLGRKGEDDLLGANCVLEGAYDTAARAVTDLTVSVQSADEYIEQLQRSGELSPSAGAPAKVSASFDGGDDDDFSFNFGDDEEEDEKPARPAGRLSRSVPARRGRTAAVTRADEIEEPAEAKEKSSALVHVEKPKPVTAPAVLKPVVLPAEIKKSPIREWLREGADETPSFGAVVLLASIAGDDDGSARDDIFRTLRQIPNMQVTVVDRAVTDSDASRGAMQVRAWLEQHAADAGLYAVLDNAGRVLEFHTVRPVSGNESVPLSAGTRFFLPVRMNDEQKTLLKIFTVCALTPTRLEHEQLLRLFVPSLIGEVAAYASTPMVGLTPEEQAVNLTAFANVLSWISFMTPEENRQNQAAALYEQALTLLPAHAPEYVFVNRQVGLLRQLDGERRDSIEAFKVAEETFRKGLAAVSEKYQPAAFADLNLRIGNVRQKIAAQTGDGDDFSVAMTAYRDALKVLKPSGDVERWADTVNGLARTMQLFSSYSTKTTLLKKAVELYEKELSVLDADEHPMLFGRASNNLASALFLLSDREGGKPDLLRRAVEVFSDALRIYDKAGARRMADVADSNMKRAERALARTEKELEKNKNWLDDILNGDGETGADANGNADASADEPLTFERIAVFEELDDDE